MPEGSRTIEARASVPVQWDTVLVNYVDRLSFSFLEMSVCMCVF